MTDKYIEYVAKAKADGKQIKRKHANGLDYIFIFESDGWVSVMNVTGGVYKPIIQAKDEAHAESYIAMIEPLPFAVNKI